jgi:hypothetical protein
VVSKQRGRGVYILSKEINDIVAKQIEERLVKFYAMSQEEKYVYMGKLLRDIEAGKEASAQIHTEALIKRCKA